LHRPESNDATYAEAGHLEYNFRTGIVEFADNAVISEGGNQISANYLVYNIAEQRISANPGGDSSDRVRIEYTPKEPAVPAEGEDRQEEELPEQDSGEDST
jgi:lipopolysaccharide transport protein LptA